MMNNSREEEQNKLATIDENLFVESLALCASEIEDNISAHIIDKVSRIQIDLYYSIKFKIEYRIKIRRNQESRLINTNISYHL